MEEIKVGDTLKKRKPINFTLPIEGGNSGIETAEVIFCAGELVVLKVFDSQFEGGSISNASKNYTKDELFRIGWHKA